MFVFGRDNDRSGFALLRHRKIFIPDDAEVIEASDCKPLLSECESRRWVQIMKATQRINSPWREGWILEIVKDANKGKVFFEHRPAHPGEKV